MMIFTYTYMSHGLDQLITYFQHFWRYKDVRHNLQNMVEEITNTNIFNIVFLATIINSEYW